MRKSYIESIAFPDGAGNMLLIKAVKEGDAVAARMFLQQYYIPVRDLSHSIFHDSALAEKHTWDVLKEALIRLRKGADCYEPSAWMRMLTEEVAQSYRKL